jgi:hypothetical protein
MRALPLHILGAQPARRLLSACAIASRELPRDAAATYLPCAAVVPLAASVLNVRAAVLAANATARRTRAAHHMPFEFPQLKMNLAEPSPQSEEVER